MFYQFTRVNSYFKALLLSGLLLILPLALAQAAQSASSDATTNNSVQHSHGYAMFDDLKYPADFTHFDYVNPNAPKGGTLKLWAYGTFDSINPYILKGISPIKTPGLYIWGVSELNAPLMVGTGGYAPSGDEPASAYGFIAESIEYPEDRSWAIFNLRKEAQFHDGSPIRAEDVVFSFNILKDKGDPSYAIKYQDVAKAEALSPLKVKFTFEGDYTRALPLRVGELPVLSKAYWSKHDFEKTTFDPFPGSGLYKIAKVDPGHSIVFERVKDHWAKDLPVNKGRYNFDFVQFDYYRDAVVAFESFKSNGYDIHLDYVAKNWATGYDFDAVNDGRVIKAEIPHQIAQGSQAFFFNLRNPMFQDRRVRKALSLLFDFEWSNKTLFNGQYIRSNSYFPNSDHAATGLPEGLELELLTSFKDQLPDELFTQPYQLPVTDGSGKMRKQRREAMKLLTEAGWVIENGILVNKETKRPFKFTILNDHSPSLPRIVQPFVKNLQLVGIQADLHMVDITQYKERMDNFDFDVTIKVLGQDLTPSMELFQYFHSKYANQPGVYNYGGIQNPVVDQLLDKLAQARSREELTAIVKAIDRVLLWEYYTLPHWHINYFRLAYWDKFGQPKVRPVYDLGIQNWWIKQ